MSLKDVIKEIEEDIANPLPNGSFQNGWESALKSYLPKLKQLLSDEGKDDYEEIKIGHAERVLLKPTTEEKEDAPLTQCMVGRDTECNHPKCPVSDEDVKNGKYCTLPLYDWRQ